MLKQDPFFQEISDDEPKEYYDFEELFQSISDLFYQYDEGSITTEEANLIAVKCCEQFIKDMK